MFNNYLRFSLVFYSDPLLHRVTLNKTSLYMHDNVTVRSSIINMERNCSTFEYPTDNQINLFSL